MVSRLQLVLLFILSAGFSSCFYSTKYSAEYLIRPSVNIEQTKKEIKRTVQQLSKNNKLIVDKKYEVADTIGYFGKPYHYFKYWTAEQDSTLTLTLKYNGSFGQRISPPYQNMLQQLSERLQNEFIIIDSRINKVSNKKLKKSRKR